MIISINHKYSERYHEKYFDESGVNPGQVIESSLLSINKLIDININTYLKYFHII